MRGLAPAALLLGAALAGCELTEVTTSPTEEILVVEAALRAGEPVQRVLLHRSLSPGDAGSDAASEVTVTTESGGVVRFQHAPRDACTGELEDEEQAQVAAGASCFVSAPGAAPWAPGERYALSVRTPDGREVGGETSVPGAYRLVSPGVAAPSGHTCRLAPGTSLPLVWTVAEGAWVYLTALIVHGLDTALAGTGVDAPARLEFTGVVISARDTTRTLPGDFIFDRLDLDRDLLLAVRDGFPEGTELELVVAAADRNFVTAVRGGDFNPSGRVRVSSLVGDGVGYFGSLVPLRVRIVVTARAGEHPPCA